jgi:arylsulfatase A-like enzyme
MGLLTLIAMSLQSCSSDKSSNISDVGADRPNILLIISDDFGMDVVSGMYPGLETEMMDLYGPKGLDHPGFRRIQGRPAATPHLNKLAREGLVFTNAWAHPFCSPTRASILTGLYGAGTGVLTYADPLTQDHLSFVSLLKESGYSTGLFGKWHLAGLPGEDESYPGMKPKEAGFDLFRGNMHAAISGYWDYEYQIQDETTDSKTWRTDQAPLRSLPGLGDSTYAPLVKVADTIEWIEQQEASNPKNPWFAWVAFNLSHATIVQQPSAMAVPDAVTLNETTRNEMVACGGEFGSNNVGVCSGEALMRAMTNSMDTVIGKLIEAVDRTAPNTLIVFIGDNGTPMYGRPNLDFIDNLYITRKGRGKGSYYQSGAEVPLLIRGPGIQADTQSDAVVHAVDLFSTILEVAGLKLPEKVPNANNSEGVALESVSLVPTFKNKNHKLRDPVKGYVLTENINLMTGGTKMAAARNARYKVGCTQGVEPGNCEFYDLERDPLEEYPLAIPEQCNDSEKYENSEITWHYCHLNSVLIGKSFFSQRLN